MHAPEGTFWSGEDGLFDHGRGLLYTIYRHASGLSDADAARLADQAATRRHGEPAVIPGGASALAGRTDTLAARLRRLRGGDPLFVPA